MKIIRILLILAALSVIWASAMDLISSILLPRVQAQSTMPWQVSVAPTAHTACFTNPNITTYCFADDGLWVSLNGAAYVQVGGTATAGVTSFNGRTGAVLPLPGDYPDAVTSVNGKTGPVVLSIQ